mmetsp:Transcript_137/g.410  ORF Transcript_137/g.410 Transcript_137/m.410 type:complete len:162 (-) Transcript_137:388-873(-)
MGNCLCCCFEGRQAKFDQLLGPILLTHKGETVNTMQVLEDKIVLLFFGAKWCPPCRQFKPVVDEFYKAVQSIENKPVSLELIYVSLDYTQEDMVQSLLEGWFSLPFEHERREQLESKYEVEELPKVVVLSPKGRLLIRNASPDIKSHGVDAYFSWLAKQTL